MLTIDIFGTKLSLTFGFLFLIAANTAGGDMLTLYCLAFCIVHELSHLASMRIFSVDTSEIRLYGGGIKICGKGISELDKRRQIIIYCSGCAANLILAEGFYFAENMLFYAVNLCLFILNLMPVSYFDGGQVLALLLPYNHRLRAALSATSICLIAGFVLFGIFASSDTISLSAMITLVFIILSDLLDG
jgi:Zn-dependent protease